MCISFNVCGVIIANIQTQKLKAGIFEITINVNKTEESYNIFTNFNCKLMF